MATARSVSERLAEFATGLSLGDVEGAALEPLKLAALDCLACILSSAREPLSAILVERSKGLTPPEATMLGWPAPRVPALQAALVNGAMGHATDYDDVSFSMWGHATAPVLPAVLAACELTDASGGDLLLAFLAGLEVEMKLGAAVAPGHYMAGWHPTSTIGVFGAAVGAGRALGLDARGMASAIGIAVSRAAGLRANFGSMTKPMHVGFAARDGLEAALLARDGVDARAGAIDAPFGFLHVMGGGGRDGIETALASLGRPFAIVEPGLCYKLYPSCSDTHIAVDTLVDLMRDHDLRAEDIARVEVAVARSVADNLVYHQPRTGTEGKFSLEYCLARAALKGKLELDDFGPDSVKDEAVARMMRRVEMTADPTIDEGSFCSPARLGVRTVDGRDFAREGHDARGHPGRPLDRPRLERKFEQCARDVLPADRIGGALAKLAELERLASVGELIDVLTPPAR